MTLELSNKRTRKIVLVVGVDLSDVSEHLLSRAREMLRSAAEGELHVVHVVHPEPLTERLTHPLPSQGDSERAGAQAAQWELKRLCAAMTDGSNVHVAMHTPVGDAANQVVRVAREFNADLVLVETHDDKRLFHVSVAAQIVRSAPCSVLTLRQRSNREVVTRIEASS